MKVLEKKDWGNWRWKCQCPKCEAKLEAEPADIVCHPSSGGNSHDYCPEYFYVVCAVCSQHISVKDTDILKYLQDQARSRGRGGSYYDR